MSRRTLAVFVAAVIAASCNIQANEAEDGRAAALDLLLASQQVLAADASLDKGQLEEADRLLKSARRYARRAGRNGAEAQDIAYLNAQLGQARNATQAGDLAGAQTAVNNAQSRLLTAREAAHQDLLRVSLQTAIANCGVPLNGAAE